MGKRAYDKRVRQNMERLDPPWFWGTALFMFLLRWYILSKVPQFENRGWQVEGFFFMSPLRMNIEAAAYCALTAMFVAFAISRVLPLRLASVFWGAVVLYCCRNTVLTALGGIKFAIRLYGVAMSVHFGLLGGGFAAFCTQWFVLAFCLLPPLLSVPILFLFGLFVAVLSALLMEVERKYFW